MLLAKFCCFMGVLVYAGRGGKWKSLLQNWDEVSGNLRQPIVFEFH